ncbi:MAG: endoglycosylceramidase [Solirubrobacteraceae bacterium]|nr:endoglycosylceramidase [Solirubrobacteraceae bacterium]
MPRRAALLSLLLLALTAPAVGAQRLPLGHHGRWMTDAHGRVVVLHGLNMVAKLPPYAPDALGFGADDARFLAREGYNSVRLGIIYKAVEPEPGRYDDAYLKRIAATVRVLGRHGITSLLDFHQDLYNERFQGEGWPDWAVMDDGLPAQPQLGFPGNYLGMPALNRAFDHFWANDAGLQDSYAAAWRHVAHRFAHNRFVMGYDLLNEPWPGSAYASCISTEGCPAFDAQLEAFTRRALAAIRAVDPDTLVFYEPHVLFNDGVKTHLADLGDDHLGFSFHDYCLTASEPGSCGTFDDLVFANARQRVEDTGDVPLMTEFGATKDPAILSDMTARADANMIGWQEWHYCGCQDPTTSGPGDTQALVLDPAKPPRGDNLDTGKLARLSRPYPQVLAGTPTRWSFADGAFTLSWKARRGRTVIAVPRRQFPKGYRARGKGVRIRSRRGARRLVVTARRGPRTLTVTPRGR